MTLSFLIEMYYISIHICCFSIFSPCINGTLFCRAHLIIISPIHYIFLLPIHLFPHEDILRMVCVKSLL